jgi:hypothetical protein
MRHIRLNGKDMKNWLKFVLAFFLALRHKYFSSFLGAVLYLWALYRVFLLCMLNSFSVFFAVSFPAAGLLREGLSGNPARAAGIAGRLGAEDRPLLRRAQINKEQ